MLPPARGYASAHKWTMDMRAVAKIVNCVRIKLLEVAGNGLLHDQPAFAACLYLLQPAGLCSLLSNTSLAQSQPKSSSCGVAIKKD